MTIQVPEPGAANIAGLLPGNIGIPALSTVYVEGMPAALATPPPSASSTQVSAQRFWSSQARTSFDPTAENLIISLSQPRLINYITMELAHFPQQASAFWWDGASWQPMTGGTGSPITYAIAGSVPQIVNNPAAFQSGIHPYHYGAGHWVRHDDVITPVTTARLLITLSRSGATGPLPVDGTGRQVAYPLGVRNLDFGYRVRTRDDVPWTPRDPLTVSERTDFTVGSDVHGSPVRIRLRENRASDLLLGKPWKCAPQARHDSVVNLYVDARDVNGNPQVIDRFYLSPVTSKVRYNLYFAKNPPPPGASFQAVDTPLVFPAVTVGGTQLPATDRQGIVFPAAGGWVQVANQATGTASNQPWWLGMEIMPQFSSSDGGTHMILDAGLIQIYYAAGSFIFSISGNLVGGWQPSFNANQRLQFVAGFDGSRLFAWLSGSELKMAHGSPGQTVSSFRFGEVQSGSSEPGNYRLTNLVIKQEPVDIDKGIIPEEFTEFAANPSSFVAPASGTSEETLNAITRFHTSFILGVPGAGINPYGFVGGPGSSYEACTWTPVLRDFELARGFAEFHPVLASVFKFEFTSLHPQPYDYFGSFFQTVKRIPRIPWPGPVPTRRPPLMHPGHDTVVDAGLTVNQNISGTVAYVDTPGVTPVQASGATLATEALYATDPATATDLVTRLGSLYNFHQWSPDTVIDRIAPSQPHSYEQVDVPHLSRLAYFVSLSSIQMYRAEFAAQDDSLQYTDNFDDTHNISASSLAVTSQIPVPWSWQAGMLTTPGSLQYSTGFARINSNVFNSFTPVRGIQFASSQSEAFQILPDPTFSDSTLGTWTNTGDALPLTIANINSQLGNMVLVSRLPGATGWRSLQNTYATWSALLSLVPTWASLQQVTNNSAFGGISYKGLPVKVSPAGRVYVAARVFSPVALNSPLALQLIDGVTGSLLAEALQPVSGGVVTEWWAGYTIQPIAPVSPSWNQVRATYLTWASTLGQNWNQIDLTPPVLGGTVIAQLIQKGATSDQWYADNISIFEDAILWEFSNDGGTSWWPGYDIRNNPNGALLFPSPAKGKGNQLMWRLSGYRPNLTVSSLTIRPWYATHPLGTPPRPAGIGHGPNIAPLDEYDDIGNDVHWKMWDLPIPREWFFFQRQLLGLTQSGFAPPVLLSAPNAFLQPGDLTIPAISTVAQGLSTYADVYPDIFEDFFGLADGSNFFTDTFTDLYDYSSLNITGTQQFATATLSGTGTLTAIGTDTKVIRSAAGAAVGQVHGDANAVTFFIARTGQPLAVRRLYLGNQIPASLSASLAAKDAQAGRKVSFDFRPDGTTTPAQLDAFLASCAAGGLAAEVTLWHGPDQHFSTRDEYFDLLARYVPVVRANGYQHIFSLSNHSILHNDAFARWYPGNALVDQIGVEFYPIKSQGIGFPTDWSGMSDVTLLVIQGQADFQGKPLGITEMGIDRSLFTEAQGILFLNYVLGFLQARKLRGKPNGDVIYNSTGLYDLTSGPASWVALYDQISRSV